MVDRAPAALSAHELTHRFGARLALERVSLQVAPGEVVAVIGPNGAGKTTLLSILAGVLEPAHGTVVRPPAAHAVGWVPQEEALYSRLTAAENLRLFARLEHVDQVEFTVSRMLDQIDLGERAHDQVRELSGGNRQRVNVALGLLAPREVLLLDEPSASLDPGQRARLWKFVTALTRDGTSVVYSTHDLPEAERHADRVLALDGGRIAFDGPPHAMHWSY